MVSLKFDSDGYLLSLHDWNESVAAEIAAGENLKLTPEHWEVITLTREFYQQHQLFYQWLVIDLYLTNLNPDLVAVEYYQYCV